MAKFIILKPLHLYPIEILDLSHRVNIRLKEKGVETLSDLAKYDEEELLDIYHFGQKSLAQIKKRLQMLNECASTHGKPSPEIIECMRLRLDKDDKLIEEIVNSVIGSAQEQTMSFYISQIPLRPAYVLIERFGMKHDKRRTLQEIANTMELTRERVRQLQVRGIKWMLKYTDSDNTLENWEETLTGCANEPPVNEALFLRRVEDSGISGESSPVGFVILATNMILRTPIPTLLKASRMLKLHRFWKKNKMKRQIA
ncbi:MAG: DNA-directed RNA polymerase subunit alpha C-terminal domain-containing protein [Caldisericia bacterium]